eukprot:CAMPEP_0117615616 /NCGR_PEP_ID=MMETSP0784-20121206/84630_1 /TAXON_ID=39447 /ORGANISM="" /LENGTH=369 /DNA_ID=CAMNT_0005419355 /DNA_START=106 /DNA_END=1211 /DNA_ORIENTATION=+
MARIPSACSPADVAAGRLRWAVNARAWEPQAGIDGPGFKFLLDLIKEQRDREAVLRFVFDIDKKRALLSRLLVRQACAAVLGLQGFDGLVIERTRGRKPFLKSPRPPADRTDLANFNFNVSHEGDWVVLASEPICVCGVDVAAPLDPERPVNIRRDFGEQLSKAEWADVEVEGSRPSTGPGHDPEYEAFQRRWSSKEAFVKARGDGLGFEPLGRASFSFEPRATAPGDIYEATVVVDGEPAPRWRFVQHRLSAFHWVTVARGPTDDVVDANGTFAATMLRPTQTFSRELWEAELRAESPGFDEVSVADLVPADAVEQYEAIIGKRVASVHVDMAAGAPSPAARPPKPAASHRCAHCGAASTLRCSRCEV